MVVRHADEVQTVRSSRGGVSASALIARCDADSLFADRVAGDRFGGDCRRQLGSRAENKRPRVEAEKASLGAT
jgi:hypothetical protein